MVDFMHDIKAKGAKTFTHPTWECGVSPDSTFATFFHNVAPDGYKDQTVTAAIGYTQPDREPVSFVNFRLNQAIKLVTLQKANFARFSVGDDVQKSNSTQPSLNDVLMYSARMKCWRTKRKNTDINKNDELFNNIIETFESLNIKGFSMHNVETTGKSFANYVTRLIWYLDPQWKTLVDQGFRVPHLVDQIYQTRTGRSLGDRIPYNDYMRKKNQA